MRRNRSTFKGTRWAKLIYGSNMSLDGFTEDADGRFDWAPPDEAVFAFITEFMRTAGTYLYGRRMLEEALAVWETDAELANHSELAVRYAAAWQAADKIVYSSTLAKPCTAKTRIERRFEPGDTAPQGLQRARSARRRPRPCRPAMASGLVDEVALVAPIVLGGRKPALTPAVRAELELLAEQRFDSGIVYLHYRVT